MLADASAIVIGWQKSLPDFLDLLALDPTKQYQKDPIWEDPAGNHQILGVYEEANKSSVNLKKINKCYFVQIL